MNYSQIDFERIESDQLIWLGINYFQGILQRKNFINIYYTTYDEYRQ